MTQRTPSEIVRAGGILLLTRCRPRKFLLMRHADRWDLPKGHCEDGESFRDAALRETWEETGIAASQVELDPDFHIDLTYPVRYKRSGDQVFTKTVRYFLGRLDETPKLKLTEHKSAQWMDWNPPHEIQQQSIDPVLAAVAAHLKPSSRDSTA